MPRFAHTHRLDPRIVVATGVVFTSLSAIFIRLSNAPAPAVAANRMIIATCLLIPLLLHQRLTGPGTRHKPGTGIPAPKIVALCVLSGLFLAIHFASWIRAVELTTIASATVIVNSQPLFVVLAGFVLFRERISRKAFIFILIIIAGGALLSSGDIGLGREALTGDLLALTGAAAIAGYLIIGRYVRGFLSARSYAFAVYATSSVFLVAACLASGTPLFAYRLREFALFAALAFFCTILGHTLFNWSLKYLKTSYVATITLGEPVFATLLGMCIFAEIPPALTIIGGVIMIAGIGAFVREESKAAGTNSFDEKAKDWDKNLYRAERTRAIFDAITTRVSIPADARVMDYGAGTGQLSFLMGDIAGSVLAVDTSPGMLAEVEKKIAADPERANVSVLLHDLSETTPPDREFDVICSAMTFHHVRNVRLLLERFHDLLAPGGSIAVADLETEDGSFHGRSVSIEHRGFDPGELEVTALEIGFTDARSERIYEILKETDGEIRKYGVFLLTAKKG